MVSLHGIFVLPWAFTFIYILAFLNSRVASSSFAGRLFISFLRWVFKCTVGKFGFRMFDAVGSLPVVSLFVLPYKPYLFTPWARVKRASSLCAGRAPLFLIQSLYFQ